jgi:hypothetical protein
MPGASTARLSALAGLLAVLAGAAVLWAPFLLRSRPVITSTPSPGPRASRLDVGLRPGSEACVSRVAIDHATAQIQVVVASRRPGTARLVMEARAPGYRGSGTVTLPVSNGVTAARARIEPPPRDIVGTVCLRNAGSERVALLGTNEATSIGLSQTSVDGRSLGSGQGAKLTVLEARNRSILARLGTIVHRAADFTGGLMPFWLAWPLVVLLVLGTPFAIFGAFWLALRDETAG